MRSKSTKVNICNTCARRKNFPECAPNNVEFGYAVGRDNIIGCNNYKSRHLKPNHPLKKTESEVK